MGAWRNRAWVLGPGSWRFAITGGRKALPYIGIGIRRGGACPRPFARKGRPYIGINGLGRFEGVDRRYVGVIERRQDLGFTLEAGQALGVGGHGLGQHLDRDFATQLAVFG